MTTAEMFKTLQENLAIDNSAQISQRYGEITSALNKTFRDTESKTANTLQVGSYGRRTAIKGISDLDMLYMMPAGIWAKYKDNGQLKLLQDAKSAIDTRYPSTSTRVDRYVVVVTFQNFEIEVVPVFQLAGGGFLYPDTYDGGSWPTTKPREEMKAVTDQDTEKNGNLRHLCKMVRAWKNKHGVGIGGLLIDTLAYNFLKARTAYDRTSYQRHPEMVRDFFEYMKEEPDKEFYLAPGSNQRVRVKNKFQRKAKKAHTLATKAIDAAGTDAVHNKWKGIFGRPFPPKTGAAKEAEVQKATQSWDDTEQHIEDLFSVDVRYSLRINCEVSQNGFRDFFLRDLVRRKLPLQRKKSLLFTVEETNVPQPYKVYWKVLNRGGDTYIRNCVRGQILEDDGKERRKEKTDFRGEHVVDCYIVKNGVVVAKDRIEVPIG